MYQNTKASNLYCHRKNNIDIAKYIFNHTFTIILITFNTLSNSEIYIIFAQLKTEYGKDQTKYVLFFYLGGTSTREFTKLVFT